MFMNSLLNFDTQLFFAINSLPHTPFLNSVFLFFSFYPIVVWIGIAIVFMMYERTHKPKMLLQLIIASLIAGLLSSGILKPIFTRPRPDISHGQQVIIIKEKPAMLPFVNDYSFPSGHASVAFAAAVVLTRYQKKHRAQLYLWATLTAFSRIYLGKHYPLDVVVGALLGYGIGYLTYYLGKRKFAILSL